MPLKAHFDERYHCAIVKHLFQGVIFGREAQ